MSLLEDVFVNLLALICFTAPFWILALLASGLVFDYSKTKKYQSYLGSTYVIQKDTLTVTDYSKRHNTFTLSNGQSINDNLIFNYK